VAAGGHEDVGIGLPATSSLVRLGSRDSLCEAGHPWVEGDWEDQMIVLGLILLILGWILGIGILWTIGLIVLIIAIVFFVLGQTGRAVGGRKYWF
jgi:hypothetical protein